MLHLVQADNAIMMVENMVMIMTMVSETDLVPHLLWTPIIISRKELEEMSEMPDDDYKYMLMVMVMRMLMRMLPAMMFPVLRRR